MRGDEPSAVLEADLGALLERIRDGDHQALQGLSTRLHGELRKLAVGAMRRERRGHTLQPTALVNEAYLALAGDRALAPENRNHFFAIAANVMNQALIQHARRRGARKRGGDAIRVTLDERLAGDAGADVDVLDLHHALEALAALDPRQAEIVRLRFFGGLGVSEVADRLGISSATVKREWRTARVWLRRELRDGEREQR